MVLGVVNINIDTAFRGRSNNRSEQLVRTTHEIMAKCHISLCYLHDALDESIEDCICLNSARTAVAILQDINHYKTWSIHVVDVMLNHFFSGISSGSNPRPCKHRSLRGGNTMR